MVAALFSRAILSVFLRHAGGNFAIAVLLLVDARIECWNGGGVNGEEKGRVVLCSHSSLCDGMPQAVLDEV